VHLLFSFILDPTLIPKCVSLLYFQVKRRVTKGILSSLCSRLINERRLIEMAFVPVNLYPILQV
jgi:hypothetical protein